ncbi:hypothetical protein DPEC_G00278730 [Dallia pectoralis]|uniref:Uncharacterized protein n=1 Tax=Dallia pectoralis TaxID=75939 RepID=A0ACC2FM66_DALPE|nr:hypothetical protein DPEC_G00278730 [Dallia pectoralis]
MYARPGVETCLATSLRGSLLSEMAFWSGGSTSGFTSKVPRKIVFMFTLSLSVTCLCYSLMSCYNSLQFPLQETYAYQGRPVTEEATLLATLREKLYSAPSQGHSDEVETDASVRRTFAVSTVTDHAEAAEQSASDRVGTRASPSPT